MTQRKGHPINPTVAFPSYKLWPPKGASFSTRHDFVLAIQLAALRVGMTDLEVHWREGHHAPLLISPARYEDEGEDDFDTRILARAKPVNASDACEDAWTLFAWNKKLVTKHLWFCEDRGLRVFVNERSSVAHTIELSLNTIIVGRGHRCVLEAALRVHARCKGRFLDVSTQGPTLNDHLVFTCAASSCCYRVQLEACGAADEWRCTGLHPVHDCDIAAGERTPPLKRCLRYFPRIDFNWSPFSPSSPLYRLSPPANPPERKFSVSSASMGAETYRKPDVLSLKDDDEPDDEMTALVAGDPFRTGSPNVLRRDMDENDASRHTGTPAQTVESGRPSQASTTGVVPCNTATGRSDPAGPLADEIVALRAHLAAVGRRLEARIGRQQQEGELELKAAHAEIRGLNKSMHKLRLKQKLWMEKKTAKRAAKKLRQKLKKQKKAKQTTL
ncbi:hypothetical protein NBRC10512_001123 [Rhodotorula toruloides]|uniref:RHTO0S06e11936g1_1 n=2 Tax=Rhodotorula toruloides TaxID=5286 RepID=A0A061AYE8_RHOTO|nr:uncharacterized protein RHTO_06647 [Rhodotorula toruloides NP11]EMS18153.1 hypothetical protein RHTO_06647 [Rhodotorula toruloides NP11]CDR42265.1 RHTO0S06e11936g1_1 [Rhodotorula toruloides]